jgi:cell division protein FtsL
MNSNGKIIFGGFIAVSAVVVLLLFSMQNSAQLKLDIEEVKQTVAEKESAIAAINSELEAAKSETKTAITKNQLIPDLR